MRKVRNEKGSPQMIVFEINRVIEVAMCAIRLQMDANTYRSASSQSNSTQERAVLGPKAAQTF
jgi:hypothetical protein